LRAVEIKRLMERERGGLPITPTVSGASSSVMVCDVRKILAWESAFGNDNGSSAITGQVYLAAKSVTLAALNPARS